jgi:intein/homing endonuclease
LKDFQFKFANVFVIKPIISKQNDRCKIGNKRIFYELTKDSSFYSNEWILPKLTKNQLKNWLRSYFDCDGWVEPKNSVIGLESVNKKGLEQILFVLLKSFKINSNIRPRKNRNIWRLTICGKDDLEKFYNEINFLHPEKRKKLISALN